MAVPAIVVAFQVKRLQLWWEKMERKWKMRKNKKQEEQKQKRIKPQAGQVINGMPHSAT